jgi:hypothetical protein
MAMLSSGKVALLALGFALTASTAQAQARPVTVVELFQSQGCSSCPPANANASALADRADLLVLSYGVTYWDQLGWKDTFASAQGTQRQWDYARGLHHENVYTPQIVLNGRNDVVGINRGELDRAVKAAQLSAAAPAITLSASDVSVAAGAAPKTGADVWLVRYDPRIVQVAIQRGENGGKTLPHRNVVREIVRLGAWSGSAQIYQIKPPRDGALRTAILLQGKNGGPILAALKS